MRARLKSFSIKIRIIRMYAFLTENTNIHIYKMLRKIRFRYIFTIQRAVFYVNRQAYLNFQTGNLRITKKT